MKTRLLIATCLLLTVAVSLFIYDVASAQNEDPKKEAPAKDDKFVHLVSSDENLFAAECWGKWKVHEDFTKYVAHEMPEEKFGTMEFAKNEKESKRIVRHLERLAAKMKERGQSNDLEFLRALKAVYATGTMKLKRRGKKMTSTFALVNMFGEPLLVLLEGKTPNTDWETVRISFVRDPDGDHDLLFVGGDHKDESYVAMQRADAK
jgi:hypothetical protein